ncbi:hypothetical protein Tco_1347733 [Tanacetum coccineum]
MTEPTKCFGTRLWKISKSYPKWDAAKPIDEGNLAELFGPDPRAHPAGNLDSRKKQNWWTRRDYRRKCEAVKAAYEAKRKKELGFLECRELEFLMIDPDSLPPEKVAYIRRKQQEIMKKYPNA